MTKVEQQYRAWRQTPESEVVMGHFRRLAQEAADGHRPCRLKALAERVRDEAGCRLNNIYVAYIGRELVLQPLVTFRKTAVERDKFPHQWLSQVNAPRRIPTARPWPSGGSCDRQAGR